MKRAPLFLTLGIGLVLVAGGAFATASSGTFAGPDYVQRFMKAGFYAGSAATADVRNKVTRTLSTTCDVDFPAVVARTGPAWIEGNPCTLTGVKVEDPCFVNRPLRTLIEVDAGTDSRSAIFGCYASAADTVKITLTPPPLQDGGQGLFVPVDPVDAGYQCRCISNQ